MQDNDSNTKPTTGKNASDSPESTMSANDNVKKDVSSDTNDANTENSSTPQLTEEQLQQIRNDIFEQLRSEDERKKVEARKQREEEQKAREEYAQKMHESDEPWVDIRGWVETSEGVRVELDWNDAFVKHLKEHGITGADDDQIVQRWVTLLLRDMADTMEDENTDGSKYA